MELLGCGNGYARWSSIELDLQTQRKGQKEKKIGDKTIQYESKLNGRKLQDESTTPSEVDHKSVLSEEGRNALHH